VRTVRNDAHHSGCLCSLLIAALKRNNICVFVFGLSESISHLEFLGLYGQTGVGRKVASLVVGLATGAAVGLLFAPTGGEEVRARIRSAVGKLGGRLRADGGSTDRFEEQAVGRETSYDVGAEPSDDVGSMSRKAIERLQKTGPE
jgi:gas vesicle protein